VTAPIGLFCFRRPDHVARTLTALAANHGARDHDLVVFADGPRRQDDVAGIVAVQQVLEDWRGRGAFRSFTIDAQSANLGLRRSIVRGVGRLCDEAGSVIVVEDDLETSPHFLRYCDEGLDLYAADEQVASIHGYVYPMPAILPETFFLRGADCWGWATWRRAWAGYDDDADRLSSALQRAGLSRAFNHGGARNLMGMLVAARDGRVDSWAIRWHASAFLANRLTLYPGRSLVRNIGLDASGTHCARQDEDDSAVTEQPVRVERIPLVEDPTGWTAIRDHFRAQRSWSRRLGRAWARLTSGRARP